MAIVLDTLALSIWNIGTRSPARLARDVIARFRERGPLVAAIVRTVIGAIFVTAGIVALVPVIADMQDDLAPTELFTLLVALALEHVVGPDLRGLLEPRERQR